MPEVFAVSYWRRQGTPLNFRFNTPQVLTDSCFWPKCCRSDSWDSLPYVVNSQCTTLYQCLTEEDSWILPWKLLWYLARKKWVAYTRNFLLWYADRFPHIHTILIFLMLISCMKQGFTGLSSFLSICHIFACFQVHRVPKSSSMKN